MCIPRSLFCDGIDHCGLAEDEQDCPNVTTAQSQLPTAQETDSQLAPSNRSIQKVHSYFLEIHLVSCHCRLFEEEKRREGSESTGLSFYGGLFSLFLLLIGIAIALAVVYKRQPRLLSTILRKWSGSFANSGGPRGNCDHSQAGERG